MNNGVTYMNFIIKEICVVNHVENRIDKIHAVSKKKKKI